ncbi:MAG: hypothetical protein F4X02_01195 [Chloroflexi bacterium]|nr:hypothetical protein [Chloroflexota bacterium]
MGSTNERPKWLNKLINIGLAALALPLVVFALFASQEMIVRLATQAIVRSAMDGVRGSYALVTLRNLWLLFGGVASVGLIIYSLDRLFKQPDSAGIRRFLLVLLAVEAVIFIAQYAVTG